MPDASAAVPGHRQRRARQDPPPQPRRRHARLRHPRRPRPVRRARRGSGHGGQARGDLRRCLGRRRRRRPHHRPVRPALQRRPRADPVAAAHRRRAPPHGAREAALAGRTHRGGRRRPRGAPRRAAHRVRRHRRQPLPGAGVRGGPRPRGGLRHRRRARAGAAQPRVRPRQGRAQGHEQDGRLHGRLLHRSADLRVRRPLARGHRRLLHRHCQQARRRRPRRHRRGGRLAPRQGVPDAGHRRTSSPPRGGRRVPVASRGSGAPVRPRDGLPPPALHPHGPLRHLQAVHEPRRRPDRAPHDAARAVLLRRGCPPAGADRRGRARQRDRQAVLHRRDELRLHQPGGSRDTRRRDEPPRRQVQHRRGRRAPRPPARPRATFVDQAGRVGPVRRHERVPLQRRRHPDQDGAGCQARRGRPAARAQGVPVGGRDASLDARRRPHQPSAAPRHLLHRGPQATHPRPQERQPVGPRPREAGLRGRRRHGRGGRLQGQGRRRPDLRARRRHRRLPAHVAQARGRSVGAGPGRDAADPAAQRSARPHRRPVRRPAQDGARRHRRRAAGRRGVRLRDRPTGRQRLHHDAGVSLGHLPGRRRDAEQAAAREVLRQGRVRRELLRVHRRGGARVPRPAGLPHPRRGHRARRDAAHP